MIMNMKLVDVYTWILTIFCFIAPIEECALSVLDVFL